MLFHSDGVLYRKTAYTAYTACSFCIGKSFMICFVVTRSCSYGHSAWHSDLVHRKCGLFAGQTERQYNPVMGKSYTTKLPTLKYKSGN